MQDSDEDRCAITGAPLHTLPKERRFWLYEGSPHRLFYDLCALGFHVQASLDDNGFVMDANNKLLSAQDLKLIRTQLRVSSACIAVPFQTGSQGIMRVAVQAKTKMEEKYKQEQATRKEEQAKRKEEWLEIFADYPELLIAMQLQEQEEEEDEKKNLEPRDEPEGAGEIWPVVTKIEERNHWVKDLSQKMQGTRTLHGRAKTVSKPLVDFFNILKRRRMREVTMMWKRAQAQSSKGRRLHVYELTYAETNQSTVDPSMTYENIVYRDIKSKLPSVFDASLNRQSGKTLIVLSSVPYLAQIGSLSNILFEAMSLYHQSTGNMLGNVTVINCFTDLEHTIPDMSFVRKVVNVIPPRKMVMSRNLLTAERDILYKGERRTVNLIRLKQDDCDDASFHFKTPLVDRWWHIVFVSKVPVCAENRLVQTSGTCWWNAAVNILILTDAIAALLQMAWSDLPKGYKETINGMALETCPSPKMPLKDFLFVLINQIVIKGDRARQSQKNFSKVGARMTKLMYSRKQDQTQILLSDVQEENEAGDGGMGLQVCLKELFVEGFHFNMINFRREWKAFNHEIARTSTLKWEYNRLQNHVKSITAERQLWKKFPHPLIIILHNTGFLHHCPLTISVNSAMYTLESAVMNIADVEDLEVNHAIAGVTCHAPSLVRYVFDSNNILVTDDWTKLVCKIQEKQMTSDEEHTETMLHNQNVLSSWRKALSRMGAGKMSRFVDFSCLVYVLQHSNISELNMP